MSDERVTSPVSVCLFWIHPLVVTEFRRILSGDDFRLEEVRIEPGLVNRIEAGASHDFALYVVDTDDRQLESEALIAALIRCHPGSRLIAVGEEFTESNSFALLRLGTKGLMSYSEVPGQLERALKEVALGGFWVPRVLLSRFVDTTLGTAVPLRPVGKGAHLTPREKQVFDDLLANLSNKDIAKKHRFTGRTAKFHVSNVLAKYGVKRRADLLLLSLQERESRAVR